jgi:ketosteroid isomerase-like protein
MTPPRVDQPVAVHKTLKGLFMTSQFSKFSQSDEVLSVDATAASLADLAETSAVANDALMRGDSATYSDLIPIGEDFVLMSPFGGTPSRAADYTPERVAAMGRFFRNGSLTQELVASWSTQDMAVLVTIERTNVEVGGLPAQDWALRVTQIYRLQADDRWHLIHRHADPLHHGINLETSAALGRGAFAV